MKTTQNDREEEEDPNSTEHARRPRSRDPHRRLSQEQLQDLGRRARRSSGSPWRHRSSHLLLSLSSSPLLSRPLASSGLPAPVGSALVGGCPASLLQEWAGFQRGLSLWVFGKRVFMVFVSGWVVIVGFRKADFFSFFPKFSLLLLLQSFYDFTFNDSFVFDIYIFLLSFLYRYKL